MRSAQPGRRRARLGLAATAVAVTALTLLAGAGSPAQAAFTDRPNSLAGARGTAPLANGGWFRERIHTLTDEDWYRFDVPKPTQVVVTLGGLPADYSLSVFDAAGRRKGGSNFRGRAFERVVFNATAAGAYYIRVDSAGGYDGAHTYAVQYRTLASGLVVLSQYAFKMTNGHVSIMADIKNTTAGWRRIQAVYVDLLDGGGRVLATDATSLTNAVLPPGGFSKINSATVIEAPAGYAAVRLRPAYVTIPPAYPHPAITVHQERAGRDSAGRPTYDGYVTNTSTTASIDDVVVDVSYYDAYGNLRLSEGYYAAAGNPIPPRQNGRYAVTMLWAGFYPPPNRVIITAYQQRF